MRGAQNVPRVIPDGVQMKNVGQGLRLLTRLIHARLTRRPLLLSHLVTC